MAERMSTLAEKTGFCGICGDFAEYSGWIHDCEQVARKGENALEQQRSEAR